MSARLSAALVIALVSVSIAPSAQAPFRSGAQTVAVYTTVTDAAGGLVTDLDKDKFEIFDDGKPQTITTFASDLQPITVVMMLDRSGSMVGNFGLVEKAAETFVERLLPGDKARIGSFSNRIEVDPQSFTNSKEELTGILRTELQEAGPTPLWNAVGVGMTGLLHVEGRRVVLVFTDGMDNPMNGSPNNLSLKGVAKRADEEDVMVYAIGLASAEDGFHRGYGGSGGGRGYGGFGGRGGGGRGRGYTDRPDPGLQTLTAASGGGYFELTRTADLTSTFARVADELHRQYLIGFVPQKNDGKSHRLEVHVKGDGLVARARKSYVAPK
ncbi:MAG TPA: VWA domain-containing protein [Vicinamibacterales bacterium]|jgi:VWFA-related protein